ncbi:hypothetical protein CCO03_16905 [Comamonas serinivorans]|uniref:N-acetyltransferase domain-containing protein n=1 Tax=Comamonas serinivorans TaxID=1082851 RepID=A0A1Y0ER41_9BURK|nr:GNAT family N-acetyltransferase [Comamonas serinivorans]ARU06127.1 hypothetical protein CCO03_16905 [Comamonas serinivorans]
MDALSMALAKQVGQPLTVELARQIHADAQVRAPLALEDWPSHEMTDGTEIRATRLDDRMAELHAHRMAYLAERHAGDPVAVQWHRIRELERQGRYVIFVAELDGEVTGSLWLHVTPSLNHGQLTVSDDLLYVVPALRRTLLASALCRHAEKQLFAAGARACALQSATGNRAGRLAAFLGYRHTAEVYTKTHWGGDEYADVPTRHAKG